METSQLGTLTQSRWVATAASLWIQATTGASYTFGIYSPALKSSQSYDQSTLGTISVFKDIGANAGIVSGLLYAAVAARRRGGCGGPWIVHAAGTVQFFAGYFLMWLAVVGIMPRPPVGVMCGFMFVAAHGQTFFNTANVVTAVRNFPDYSGTAVGIIKGFLGLSGAILVQVYLAFFKGEPSTFILMLALLPTTTSLLMMCFVRVCPVTQVDDKKHLNGFSITSLVLMGYLMLVIILENVLKFPHWTHYVTVVFLVLLLCLPFKTAIEASREDESQAHSMDIEPLVLHDTDPIRPDQVDEHRGDYEKLSSGSSIDKVSTNGEDMNIMEAMCSFNFWMLFIAMACGLGSGLATANNMSQIGESLGYPTLRINTLVSLWSIWNFLGRFGAGYVSDVLLHQKGLGRPFMMAITLATMTVGHLIIASGFPGNLYIGTFLVGICYGSQWSLMPTMTSEVFGVLHMGTIFNTIAVASPLGTYVLSVWVIGHIYDKETGNGKNSCSGIHCFMTSFFILACVSFVGFLVALFLFFRTRRFYKYVVLGRLHHFQRR